MKHLVTLFLSFGVLLTAFGQLNESIIDQTVTETIPIQCALANGRTSTGTGFFFRFWAPDSTKRELVTVITNKHVINGSGSITLFFRRALNGKPVFGNAYAITIPNDSNHIVYHPNPNVDLVAIPINDGTLKSTVDLYYRSFTESLIPNEEILETKINHIENVFMVGYPNATWDAINNMPIVRRGITASSIKLDFNGKKEFLMDIAIFPGSSGSPVICYKEGPTEENGQVGWQKEMFLVGIAYLTSQYTEEAVVLNTDQTDTTRFNKTVNVKLPLNLGVAINATEILGFKKVIKFVKK